MTEDEFIARMTQEVAMAAGAGGTESAAFLAWFLTNFFRIDDDAVRYYICDKKNDKGIDGVYVDDVSQEVFVFQSKYSRTARGDQGDVDMRNFVGARTWFESPDNVEALDNSLANQELKALVRRLQVADRLRQGYELRCVFVTSKVFDTNATDYLTVAASEVDAWDIQRLFGAFTYAGKDAPISGRFSFGVQEKLVISYPVSAEVEVLIFPAKATDLVRLDGIQDRTLFDRNVRYGLGRTRVNKEIEKTLRRPEEHDNFFLYHNGITLTCSDFEVQNDSVTVCDYCIVNGCQSTMTFYEQRDLLSEDIRVLLRVIKTGLNDQLGQQITYYNNNQNAIAARDLRSNDKVQQDIYQQFSERFPGQILYKYKRGQDESGFATVIGNDLAAQLLVSFLIKEPHVAHQKAKLFEDRYSDVFSRHVTPHLIALLHDMYCVVEENSQHIEDEGMRTYGSTRFFFVYLFRRVLEDDERGKQLIEDPAAFYQTYRDAYRPALQKLFGLLALDLNNYVSDRKGGGNYFDYKNALRNAEAVENMSREVITAYRKGLVHHPEDSFTELLSSVPQVT